MRSRSSPGLERSSRCWSAAAGQPEPLSRAGGATPGNTFDGDLFEIVRKNGAATSADMAAVESYFHTKYGTP